MPCLTIIDVTGIQDYIFGSNRLKEIVGASEIVAQATSWWIFEVLRDDLNWKTNLKARSKEHKSPFDVIDEDQSIKDQNLDAEVIYAGGGNTLILFADKKRAVDFTKKYSVRLLKDARGLETVIAHSDEFDMSNGKVISEIADKTFAELNIKKNNRQVSSPMLGLAVTAQCVSTGGVASEFDEDRKKYISKESYQKQQFSKKGNERLKNDILEQLDWKGLSLALDFDYLGRTKGETSFIAVVHTDGNGVGKRVERVGENENNNQEWVKEMRKFSKSIYDVNIKVMEKTVDYLLNDRIDDIEKVFNATNEESFDLSQKETEENSLKTVKTYFPFRPLIFGGDDLTFVCDGRIALSLTAFYLKELVKKDENGEFVYKLSDGKPIYARAGVAIIKSHYPFSRAYKLAEELANTTKEKINEIDEDEKEVVTIDWHAAMSGLLGNLEEIRERKYTVRDGKLNMRPLVVYSEKSLNNDWRTWENFSRIINELQGNEWKEKRNKLKTLREYLRKGKNESKSFLHLTGLELPIPAKNDGWENQVCVHFDAIEMLDLYFPIEKTEVKSNE